MTGKLKLFSRKGVSMLSQKETYLKLINSTDFYHFETDGEDNHAFYFVAMHNNEEVEIKVEKENYYVSYRYTGNEDWQDLGILDRGWNYYFEEDDNMIESFLITNDVNKNYDKILKICGRKHPDFEKQLSNGFMVLFENLPFHISLEIQELKNVTLIKE